MTLRSKLLLAQSPLILALAVSGIVASATIAKLGKSPGVILRENYRSVLAAQRMKDALSRIAEGAFFALSGRAESRSGDAAVARRMFEAELAVEEQNITEAGEAQAAKDLRTLWTAYAALIDDSKRTLGRDARERLTFDRIHPAYLAVKTAVDAILDMNQDAMVLKSDRAETTARRMHGAALAVAIGSCAAAILAASALISRLMRPLGILGQAARRIGEGDLEARALVAGEDEIARLAREFNTMAEKLQKFHESSLGDLLEAHQAAQAAIDSLPDPVVVLSVEGRLLRLNRAAEVVLGIRPDARGDPLAAAGPEMQKVLATVREHVIQGRGAYVPKGLEEAVVLPGSHRSFLPRATPVYSEDGSVIGTTIVLQDVTRLVRFNELNTNLVATVAHEFRTPLTSLHMAIHLLAEQAAGPLTEKQADLLFAAREDCERLRATVDELLDLSRIQTGQIVLRRTDVDAEMLVRTATEAHKGVAAERGVRLKTEVLPGLATVAADPERIKLVFANVFQNAIRKSPGGGEVVVSARLVDGRVRIEVRDEGPGIPAEYREAVFEKHFRLPGEERGGAGLGLYIAREIVQAHGGTIGIDGLPGKGCAVWIELPAVDGAGEEPKPA